MDTSHTTQDAQIKLAKDLWEAVHHRDVIKVRSLLVQGADPNHQFYWSEEWRLRDPLLHNACYLGYLEIVKTLVTHGARTDKGSGRRKRVPIHCACEGGHKDVVEYFIQEVGCSTDVKDDHGQSPLDLALDSEHLYAVDGCVVVALYLMSRGCGSDEDKAKLLCGACQWGKLGVVKELIEQHKVDPKNLHADVRDDEGQTPLDITLGNLNEANDCMDVALYLMSLGCGGDEGKAKLLCGACLLDKLDVVKELVEQYKVEPKNVRDDGNRTPLHIACSGGHRDVVQYLVAKANCDINMRDDKGQSLLDIALERLCIIGCVDVALYLMSRGCGGSEEKVKLLCEACYWGKLGVVKELVEEHQVDPKSATDNDGVTPLDIATQKGITKIADYLKSLPQQSAVTGENDSRSEDNIPPPTMKQKVTSDSLSGKQTPSAGKEQPETTDTPNCFKQLFSSKDDETSSMFAGTPLTEEDSDALQQLLLDNKIEGFALTSERTYEKVLHHLREQRQEELATNLRRNLDKVLGEQKRYLKKLDDLMTDKETIYIQYLQLLLVGPPSVGKTTTLSRLLKDIENISSAGDKTKLCSTLLTNCDQAVAYINKDATEWVCSKDADEEAKILFGYMYSNKIDDAPSEEKRTKTGLLSKNHTKPSPEKPRPTPPEETHTERREKSYQQNRFLHIKTRLQKLIKSGNYSQMAKCLGNTLLNINDVGGQPGFLKMLPALCNGPAMYLVFLDLSKELDKPYEIPFSRDATVNTPFKAIHTVEATVSQILSAVASVHHVSRPLCKTSKLSKKFETFQQVCPVAALIGTHMDQLKNPKEKIKQVNDALKVTTEKFAEILVSPPSDSECSFFAVDNFAGTEQSDIAPIRNFISKVCASHFNNASLPIKPKWLLLGTLLRIEYSVSIVSVKDCLEIGKLLEMEEEDTKFCLWYLHQIGSILHYRNVPNDVDGWLKNHMFCTPEVIFTSIRQLVLPALRLLHSEGHVTEFERAELIKMGQFSLKAMIKYCTGSEVTKMLKEGKIIPAKQLIILLQYLNLLSEIVHKDTNDPNVTRVTYLMPAILDCASQDELTNPPQADTNNPEPLHITFSFGYVPTGVFCGMIARLVSQGPHGILGLTWELMEDAVKQNYVSFYVDYVHKVTLISHDRSYEIRVERNAEQIDFSLHDLCSHILSAILYLLKNLFPKLNFSVAFQCYCSQHAAGKTLNNLCTLVQGRKIHFLCSRNPVTLRERQQVWLGKHVSLGSSTELEVLKFAEGGFSFHWTKEGSRRHIKTTDDRPNTLSFQSVSEEDFGHYQCEVKDQAAGKVVLNLYIALYKEKTRSSVKDTNKEKSANQPIVLTGADIQTICEGLKTANNNWFKLGLALGLNFYELKNIESRYQDNGRRLMEMIGKRLEVTDPKHPITWPYICQCLRSPTVERNDVADNIKDSYILCVDSNCSSL